MDRSLKLSSELSKRSRDGEFAVRHSFGALALVEFVGHEDKMDVLAMF